MSKVFFSWQADRPGKTGRHLIHRSLEDAIEAIKATADVEDADRDEIHVDSDTRGVAGTPPIVETILKKIDAARAFVADITFVGDRADGRKTPNPNVMIEYGYALHALTWERVVGVMNTAYGDPANVELPFDLGHMRRPITYTCTDDADAATIRAERKKLTSAFKVAIELILALDVPLPTPRKEFVPLEPAIGSAWFRPGNESIGVVHDGSVVPRERTPVRFAQGPVMWLRVLPKFDHGKNILNSELRTALVRAGNMVRPLNSQDQGGDLCGVRGADGYGLAINVSNGMTFSVVYAFDRGEVWSIDAGYLHFAQGEIFFSTEQFTEALVAFADLLERLGVSGPYRWMAGISGIKGRSLHPVGTSFVFPPAASEANGVERQGEFSGDPTEAAAALEPFFAAVYDLGHLTRG